MTEKKESIINELRKLCEIVRTAPHKEAKDAKKAIQKMSGRELRGHRPKYLDFCISELDRFDTIDNPVTQTFLVRTHSGGDSLKMNFGAAGFYGRGEKGKMGKSFVFLD